MARNSPPLTLIGQTKTLGHIVLSLIPTNNSTQILNYRKSQPDRHEIKSSNASSLKNEIIWNYIRRRKIKKAAILE